MCLLGNGVGGKRPFPTQLTLKFKNPVVKVGGATGRHAEDRVTAGLSLLLETRFVYP